MIVCVLGVFLVLVAFSRELYDFISSPLVALLPKKQVLSPPMWHQVLAPIRLTFCGVFISIPVIIGQIWGFVRPALYKHEKRIAVPLLLSAVVLFYVGMAFAYFVVLVPALKFFVMFAPDNVLPMTDIDSYLSFVLKLFWFLG